MRFLFKFVTCKFGPLTHLNVFHVFPRDNIRKTFIVMHTCNPVFEHSDTLSCASLASIIFYIIDTQFRCSVFTFVQLYTKVISRQHRSPLAQKKVEM